MHEVLVFEVRHDNVVIVFAERFVERVEEEACIAMIYIKVYVGLVAEAVYKSVIDLELVRAELVEQYQYIELVGGQKGARYIIAFAFGGDDDLLFFEEVVSLAHGVAGEIIFLADLVDGRNPLTDGQDTAFDVFDDRIHDLTILGHTGFFVDMYLFQVFHNVKNKVCTAI
jgi:hypothetical protein